ncbi:MAG: hypothetical protein F9K46_15260 [Anaerolineae bacterium]|nr:MAG: hypothetical protein F9K46_15260 [Anaerolineae bacterium]
MTPTTLIILLICASVSIWVIMMIAFRRAPYKPPYFDNEAEWVQNAPSGPLHSIRPTVLHLAYLLSIHRYRDEAIAYIVAFHDHFPRMPEVDDPDALFLEAVRYAWRLEIVVKEWREKSTLLYEAAQKFETGLTILEQSGWRVESRPADTDELKYYRLAR